MQPKRHRSTTAAKQTNLRIPQAKLTAMVEEAIVDCYGESEQVCGLFTLLEQNLAVPFSTEVLGVSVTVERVDLTQHDEIVAVCSRAGHRQDVPILSLPVPTPPPTGAEWIAAYRHWLGGA